MFSWLVDVAGVRKEEIKVDVEDSRYLIIRTEAIDESTRPTKSFMRKFQLLDRIDINGISAGYEDGVRKVTVPRLLEGGDSILTQQMCLRGWKFLLGPLEY